MESISIGRRLFLCAAISLSCAAAACADGENNDPTGGSSTSATGTGGSGAAGGGGAGGGMGGAGGGATIPPDPEFVAKFNPVIGELPEGLVIDGTTAYVSFGPNPKVVKVDLTSGTVSDYGTIPNALISITFPQGLALDAQKNLYVAVRSEDPTQYQPGIYKFPPGGGDATLFASDPMMPWPRSINFMPDGNALVAVPSTARVLVVSKSGSVFENGTAPLFFGDEASPCAYKGGVNYGVTSAVLASSGKFYATNADRALIVDGTISGTTVGLGSELPTAGPDCDNLGGAESMLIDPKDNSFILAARKSNKITRVPASGGGVEVLAEGKNLYQPSAVAIATIVGKRWLYIVNSADSTYNTGGIPALLRMPL